MSRRWLTVLALSMLTLLALGCDQGTPAASAWVSELRDAHQQADAAEQRGDFDAARRVLEPLASAAPPHDVAPGHARAARQDLYFRLATLASLRGDHAAARDAAADGLELGQEDDVLTANLLIARAEAHEALGEREGASRDFLSALRINEVLLDAVLGEEGSR